MSKKSHFREPFDKWHGKRTETLFKSEWQHLYQIYCFLWTHFRLKKSLWVISKILGLFLNPFTANNKYSLLNRDNFFKHFQMHLSQKRKIFSNFFLYFINFNSVSNIFKKTMSVIADVFLKIWTPKNVISCLKKV